jgi:hypothetical protein
MDPDGVLGGALKAAAKFMAFITAMPMNGAATTARLCGKHSYKN